MVNTEQLSAERRKLIEDWTNYTSDRLKKKQMRLKIGKTMELYNSTKGMVMGGLDPTGTRHQFLMRGRFVDMGVGRGQKIADVKGNADLRGLLGIGRKPKKWYSKTFAAETARLTELLADKYASQSALLMKENLQGKII